jgi:hypothetical protein
VGDTAAMATKLEAPEDLTGLIRETKAALRRQIGDVAGVFAEVEDAMRRQVADVISARERGDDVIPVVQFSDVEAGTVPESAREAIRLRGCAVVRQTFPRARVEQWDAELADYLERNRYYENQKVDADQYFSTLQSSRPQIFGIYWSKPQVQARQDERMEATRTFMNSIWRSESEGRTWFHGDRNLTYADRVRRRQPGDSSFGLSPHIDSGSIERWLVPAYQDVYRHVFSGDWRRFDPWDAAHRTEVHEYESTLMCSVFRTFQGWTALSEMQPTDGVLHLIPITNAIVYLLLRPLLDDVADDDLLAAKGRALSITDETHPAITPALTPIPPMEPGDTVWWHTDVIHSVGDVNEGERWGNVMYIAAVPYCDKNAAYVEREQATFLRGESPPDFAPENYEVDYPDRATVDDLTELGRKQIGLDPW